MRDKADRRHVKFLPLDDIEADVGPRLLDATFSYRRRRFSLVQWMLAAGGLLMILSLLGIGAMHLGAFQTPQESASALAKPALAATPRNWGARCFDQGQVAGIVSASSLTGLMDACQQLATRPSLDEIRDSPCGIGVPGCRCAGTLIQAAGATAWFEPGAQWETCSGYRLVFQTDGNLVLYNPAKQVIWASWTNGRAISRMAMQADGNLVLYTPENTPAWTSDTYGNPGAFLAVQEDGNLVIYRERGRVLWATNTYGR